LDPSRAHCPRISHVLLARLDRAGIIHENLNPASRHPAPCRTTEKTKSKCDDWLQSNLVIMHILPVFIQTNDMPRLRGMMNIFLSVTGLPASQNAGSSTV
jgi:hypothetical protein